MPEGAGAFEPNSGGATIRRGERRLCVQNSLSVFVFWILAALLAPAGAQAQALLGEIKGNVVDATQAAIVGATVVAHESRHQFQPPDHHQLRGWVYSC